jgi:Anti-sigma-K factor rskA
MIDQENAEQQLARIQALTDRLGLSLEQWHESQERLQPMERRLSQLLERGGQVVDRLTATDERHMQAVGDAESQLQKWSAIENSFRERAKALDDICEAATSSVTSIEQAESRLATLEADMHLRLSQLSTEIQGLLAPLRGSADPRASLTEGPEAWPLERVMRLHDELRQSAEGRPGLPSAGGDSTALLASRIESLELALTAGKKEFAQAADRRERQRRPWSLALGVLALGVIAIGALAVWLNQRIDIRLNEAAARVTSAQRQAEAATELANRRVASAQENAERKIAESQQTASRARIVSDVLAAPDLIRFNLVGADRAPLSSAQLLWSQSRGVVFSGSRVPAAPAGTTNQLWLLTSAQPVSAGLFVPDSKGRVTLVTDDLPNVPRPVIGAAVTLEPAGGRPQRSAATVLSRALVATRPVEVTPPPPSSPPGL